MPMLFALALLQAAAPAGSSAPLALTCTSADAKPPVTFAFQIDLPKESFTLSRNGGAPQTGNAQSFGNRVVLELPSTNPDAIPMFFLNTDAKTYKEVTRAGASAMTPVTDGTCK